MAATQSANITIAPRLFNGFSVLARKETIDLLNRRLADSLDLMLQAKQVHWTVRGPNFLSLHELFDRIAAGSGENADHLAERVMQLGGKAEGTAQVVVRISQIAPYPIALSDGEEHIERFTATLGKYAELIRLAIDECAHRDDAVSADIFTGISRAAEKWLWMVEAHK
ncbi:MAG: DNA starvation/stationary phase protection protein Dps [Candidatus Binataceae bacterium]